MREVVRRILGLLIFIGAILVSPSYVPAIASVFIGLAGLFLATNIVSRQQ